MRNAQIYMHIMRSTLQKFLRIKTNSQYEILILSKQNIFKIMNILHDIEHSVKCLKLRDHK